MSPRRSPRIAALTGSQDDHQALVQPPRQVTPAPRSQQARQAAAVRRGTSTRRPPPARPEQAPGSLDQSSVRGADNRGLEAQRVLQTTTLCEQEIFQFPDPPTNDNTTGRIVASSPDVAALPPGGKPSRKNITVELFSGFVSPGAFDSGVRRWWRKFLDQLSDAQILDGHRWSDVQCRSIFAASLSGDAADWYSELRLIRSDFTLLQAGSLLVEKYMPRWPEQELMSRVMTESKRRQESYQEYAQRLLNMADSLPGGLAVEANAHQALHNFVKRAYYKYTDELKSYVGRVPVSKPAAQKLQLLVDHLSYMADSDGRLPAKATSLPVRSSSFKRMKTEKGTSGMKAETAAAMLVEHKRKKYHSGNRPRNTGNAESSSRCFNCKQTGHFARDCPEKQGRDLTTPRLQGSAAAALNEDSA